MQRIFRGPAVATALLLAACGPPADTPGADLDPRPSDPARVEMVGPGTISSDLPEFATALAPSGDTLWFNRTSPDRTRIELFWTVRTPEGWTDPVLFPPTEGTVALDPFVEPGGGRLWVTADRPRPDGTDGGLDLWYLDHTPAGWSEPRFAPPPLNSEATEVFNSLTREGLMVFSSTRSDGVRRIWTTRADDGGGWVEPESLELGLGPGASNPAVAPDGSFLVLALPGRTPAPDLAVWCRDGAGWRRGAPLPDPVNTRWAEFAPAVAGDHLWFTSERPGRVGEMPDSVRPPGDLYRTELSVVRGACGVEDGPG